MKIQTVAAYYAPILSKLCCPACRGAFHLDGGSLLCESGHCFDLSKKGYLNLAPGHRQAADQYDERLFSARKAVFQAGFYQEVLEAIAAFCRNCFGNAPFSLADIGCGEGYYTRSLHLLFPEAELFALDLSRDAIVSAAGDNAAAWLVADLKHLPFPSRSLDCILDVLTPADYEEFSRVLKKEGFLIKVIPGKQYLRQIRDAVSPFLSHREGYDNQPVIDHMLGQCDMIAQTQVLKTFPLTEEQSFSFLRMTPMTFSVPEEALKGIRLREITVDMQIYLCKMKAAVH